MLHDFSRHMAVYRMKSRPDTLRSWIKVSTDVIENGIRLKPKTALDGWIEFRTRKATDLEAELNAPGHEVAYIDKVRRHFD